jgi:hypothetical protein
MIAHKGVGVLTAGRHRGLGISETGRRWGSRDGSRSLPDVAYSQLAGPFFEEWAAECQLRR